MDDFAEKLGSLVSAVMQRQIPGLTYLDLCLEGTKSASDSRGVICGELKKFLGDSEDTYLLFDNLRSSIGEALNNAERHRHDDGHAYAACGIVDDIFVVVVVNCCLCSEDMAEKPLEDTDEHHRGIMLIRVLTEELKDKGVALLQMFPQINCHGLAKTAFFVKRAA